MQDEEDSPNVLLSLKRRNAADDPELKCMALNKVRCSFCSLCRDRRVSQCCSAIQMYAVQVRPNEVAVGAHDHYIRIYDRRMLCTGKLVL